MLFHSDVLVDWRYSSKTLFLASSFNHFYVAVSGIIVLTSSPTITAAIVHTMHAWLHKQKQIAIHMQMSVVLMAPLYSAL